MPGPQPCHLPPCILCIVGRGLDRLTAHNERRQPAKLARSCGCLPCRGKHCSLPDFAPLNRGPTLTTPHLRGASGTPPPTTIRRASHYRKRPRRPGGRPPYIPLYHIPWGGPSPATHSRHPVGAGHARPATSPPPAVNLPPLTPHNLCPRTAITPIYTLPKLRPQTLSKKSKKLAKTC